MKPIFLRIAALSTAALLLFGGCAAKEEPNVPVQATAAQTTQQTTAKPTVLPSTAAEPTTEPPTVAQQPTTAPQTAAETTAVPTTAAKPTTAPPTAAQPTTVSPATEAPATEAPSTAAPQATKAVKSEPYSDESLWMYYGEGEDKPVDVFYICSTIDQDDEMNMRIDDEHNRERMLNETNTKLPVYSDYATVYSPYYRQISFKTYRLHRKDREPYLSVAYADISNAFRYYLKHSNNGRPIILAGFSQGADMCYRLLEEYFGDKQLRKQLVAVYAIGWGYSRERAEQFPQIVPATGEDDVGTVISYDCESPETEDTFLFPKGMHCISINPLNWKTDATPADRSLNKGACKVDADGDIVLEEPQLCGCYLDTARGSLKITDIDPDDFPTKKAGMYHSYDYRFFYRNLQDNVGLRLKRYFEQQK